MNYVFFISGMLLGAIAVYIIFQFIQRKNKKLLEDQKILTQQAQNDLVRYETENRLLKEKAAETEDMQKALSEKFENLANKIFDEKDRKNTDKIKLVLEPIEKDINHFRKKIEEMNMGTGERMAKLSEQIKNLQELNREITEETQNLTKALKGDVKKQGNWGELILERLLEMSGLRKNIEYETQTSVNDEGDRRQLDVLIKLPENKHLIIDSKVSMLDYEKLIKSENPDEVDRYKKSLSMSIKAHIDGLASKHYQTIKGINSPDYVFMFIPIEGAFSSILGDSMSLYQYAINKNVMIVSPTTLLASLRTVSALWQQENQTKNALDIAIESGKLLDKFSLFYEDFQKIGRNLQTLKTSYDGAENKLQTGRGSLVSRAKKIQQMGAKTSKQLPETVDSE
ncbi:MAG: DNA recombination protein RmuC [Candidatus Marinimicrobia bacterium]|nr:DNA recombination protein RmuC [Candidatus Neomarinimicrobiota bacterium]